MINETKERTEMSRHFSEVVNGGCLRRGGECPVCNKIRALIESSGEKESVNSLPDKEP